MNGMSPSDVFSLSQAQVVPQARGKGESLEQAVSQFESLFVDMMLKSMRLASSVFGEGSYLSSNEITMHQQMLDQQLSVSLSERGGIGLADALMRQLGGEVGRPVADASLASFAPITSGTATPVAIARPADPAALEGSTPVAMVPVGSIDGVAESEPGITDKVVGFIREFSDRFERALEGTQLNPQILLAQAALETGWGEHQLRRDNGESANNLFGIKATAASPDRVARTTLEFYDGQPINQVQSFRAYGGLEEGIQDYVNLVTGLPRYAQAVQQADDVQGYAQGLQAGGYATDPHYAVKIKDVYDRIQAALQSINVLSR